jgi:hypothetical protein
VALGRKLPVIIVLLIFLVGFASGMYWQRSERGVPFVKKAPVWSIGIYRGSSPLQLTADGDGTLPEVVNPVLTAEDVTDVHASFVADPFMVYEPPSWFMFFEVLNQTTGQGDIGLATSENGVEWTYRQIVLDEPFHLSYPYVFKWQDEYYMIPESGQDWSIRLYKATNFPFEWSFVRTLLNGTFADSSLLRFNDMWWLFTCSQPYRHDTLRLYYANDLLGPWMEHPQSPLVKGNRHIGRPGGRVIAFDDRIIRYAQDARPFYGRQLRALEITVLTTTRYEEVEVPESPILTASSSGWNAQGMHHIDPHRVGENQWMAVVDGHRDVLLFGLRY